MYKFFRLGSVKQIKMKMNDEKQKNVENPTFENGDVINEMLERREGSQILLFSR